MFVLKLDIPIESILAKNLKRNLVKVLRCLLKTTLLKNKIIKL